MKLAIMQPYFLPYLGYFQLIASADLFVVYDNIEYTKKGWINRNRLLRRGEDVVFSIPIKNASDYLHVNQRELSPAFNRKKLLNQIRDAYRKAPCFSATFDWVEKIVLHQETNLFAFVHHAIVETCRHLRITTPIRISSGITIDHSAKNQDKVLALCTALGANTYINPLGGIDLYSKETFARHGIALRFLQPRSVEYRQFGDTFVPWLSILDVMMFNSLTDIEAMLQDFELC